jgi:hypothetical protein
VENKSKLAVQVKEKVLKQNLTVFIVQRSLVHPIVIFSFQRRKNAEVHITIKMIIN